MKKRGNGKGETLRLPKLPKGCIFKSRGTVLEKAGEKLFLLAAQNSGLTPFGYCKSREYCKVTEICQKKFSIDF